MIKNKILKLIVNHHLIIFLTTIILFTGWGSYHVSHVLKDKKNLINNRIIDSARMMEISLDKKLLCKLTGKPSDVDSTYYKEIKNKLMELVRVNNESRFIYLYTKKNNELIMLVDSEDSSSVNYSPPGQIYKEAKYQTDIHKPFDNGKMILAGPTTDRWGR